MSGAEEGPSLLRICSLGATHSITQPRIYATQPELRYVVQFRGLIADFANDCGFMDAAWASWSKDQAERKRGNWPETAKAKG